MKKLVLLIFVISAVASAELTAAARVSFTLENRRVSGVDYLIDIYAEPSSEGYEVGSCNIVMKYNSEALDAGIYQGDAPIWVSDIFEDKEYYFLQNEYSESYFSLDILTFESGVILEEKTKLATVKLKIVDADRQDNLRFFGHYSNVYLHDYSLRHFCIGTGNDYCLINPGNTNISDGDNGFVLGIPELYLPEDEAALDFPVELNWAAATGADYYRLQVSQDINFADTDIDTVLRVSDFTPEPGRLLADTRYYWRVAVYDRNGIAEYSETRSFNSGVYIHAISLQKGWNMISSYVVPEDTDIENILSLPEVFLVKNTRGAVYMPNYGIDGIGTWNYQEGYLVYMTSAATLEITGNHCSILDRSIALKKGWNMVAYLSDKSRSIEDWTSELIASGDLFLAKSSSGAVFMPNYGINSIGTVHPGESILLYMLDEGTLNISD